MSIQKEDKLVLKSFIDMFEFSLEVMEPGGENRVNWNRLGQPFVRCVKGGLESFYCVIQSMEFALVLCSGLVSRSARVFLLRTVE